MVQVTRAAPTQAGSCAAQWAQARGQEVNSSAIGPTSCHFLVLHHSHFNALSFLLLTAVSKISQGNDEAKV